MNLACQIARQIENLALRMVFETTNLSAKTKSDFYRNLLYAQEGVKRSKMGTNGASKTHQWALKAVLGCPYKNPPPVNPRCRFVPRGNDDDPFTGFSPDGTLADDPYEVLVAFPGDPHLEYLNKLFIDNNVLGNILLVARREFFSGFNNRWEDRPPLPASYCLTSLIEEMARQMDTETATNLTQNFLRHQSTYISWRLQQLSQANPELDFREKLLPELLVYLVDLLPLDDRPDLMEVQGKVNYDGSEILRQFVEDERLSLGRMMGSTIVDFPNLRDVDDDVGVDIKFALGWGDRNCVQADHLLPALLTMARDANLHAVMIPENGLSNRPITFNSGMTGEFLRNLSEFAKKYDMDETIVDRIGEQFKEHVKDVDDKSPEYDLKSIEFLAMVRIFEFNSVELSLLSANVLTQCRSSGRRPFEDTTSLLRSVVTLEI
jgi:hypothetical protein